MYATIVAAHNVGDLPAELLTLFTELGMELAETVVGRLATAGTFPWVPFLFSMAGSLVVFAIGVWIGLRLFNRERLLYSM